jgi:manganese transport protein
MFTGRADIMGKFADGAITRIAGVMGTAIVLFLNAILVPQTLGVPLPGLPGSG